MATYQTPEDETKKPGMVASPQRSTNPVGTPSFLPKKKAVPKPQPNNAIARRLSKHEQHMNHEEHLAHLNHMNRK